MATAITMRGWVESEDFSADEITEVCEEAAPEAQGSWRFVERHRQAFDAEVGRAKRILKEEAEDIYCEETLDRATAFLKLHMERLWETVGVVPPMPMIGSGPNRSVDLFWKETSWELLVNIPAAREKQATFYGDDYGQEKAKGSFDPLKFSYGVAAWLMA